MSTRANSERLLVHELPLRCRGNLARQGQQRKPKQAEVEVEVAVEAEVAVQDEAQPP